MVKQGKRVCSLLLCFVVAAALIGVQPFFISGGRAAASTTAYTITAKDGPLKIYSTASSSGKVLGSVPKGKTLVSASRKKSGTSLYWYKITYNKHTGYVSGRYLQLQSTVLTYRIAKEAYTVSAVSVRPQPSSAAARTALLKKNTSIRILGWHTTAAAKKWGVIKYKGKTSYVSARCVKLGSLPAADSGSSDSSSSGSSQSGSSSDASGGTGSGSSSSQPVDFETYMKKQGFPDSYKPYLRKLHKAHPKWVFKAQNTGLKWSTVIAKEKTIGNNLVEPDSPSSYKSKSLRVYNPLTKKYRTFDGRWNQASDAIIKYYMDPRNFLNSSGIYQFMSHKYNSDYQNKSTIRSITSMNSSCFLDNSTNWSRLLKAGQTSHVNPNVLTAMIIQEQGWRGTSSLISGLYSGYRGYYNYFNIGAYCSGGMNAVQRGLWYASGEGRGRTSYGRPWDSRQKSMTGGACFYYSGYVSKKQYTYYTKKFNVCNGSSNVAEHEYMTNVEGACSEGRILSYAYRKKSSYASVFYIPVYKSMPAKKCTKPK
ncbi:MAG: SH3 domain-containing protein [Anaerovoracaceae bacterium]|jgi:beta-N-acetylglucosaminidase